MGGIGNYKEGNEMTLEQQWQQVQDLIDAYLERGQQPPAQLIAEEERILTALQEQEQGG